MSAVVDELIHDWRDVAACRQYDAEMWFPQQGRNAGEAKRICGWCPAAEECLSYALETGQDHGVWGGLSEEERRVLRRKGAKR